MVQELEHSVQILDDHSADQMSNFVLEKIEMHMAYEQQKEQPNLEKKPS